MSSDISIFSIFYNRVKCDPEKIFIYQSDGKHLTYNDVFTKSLQTATLLSKAGISKGKRVALMMENSDTFLFIWLAISRLEAVMIPVNTQYKSLGLRHILSDSKADAIIYDNTFREQTESALEVLDQCHIQLVNNADDESENAININDDLSLFGGPFNPLKTDVSIVYYSAGTLGPPKGAVYSNERLLNNMDSVFDMMHPGKNDIIGISYPFYHYFAQICGIASVLLSGSSMMIAKCIDYWQDYPEEIISRCRVLLDTPDCLSEFINREDAVLPSNLEYVMTGGQALEKSLPEEYLKRFKKPLFQAYGMVEAGPVLTINMNPQKKNSIGVAVHDTTVSVMSEGKLLRQGTFGTLALPDSQLAGEYCGRFKQNEEDFQEGWFYGPDMGYRDIDGYLFFLDRKVNKIKIDGFDVFPELIETKLKSHEDIKEAVVIGINRGNDRNYIQAHLVIHRGRRIESKDIIDWLTNKLPKYQIPKEIIFEDHLPKNIAGKVSRQTLRKSAVSKTGTKLEE